MASAAEQVEAKVAAVLARGEGRQVASPGRSIYLDLAENVARQASAWQCEHGMIGDPHNAPGVESVTATARYCAALGHLLRAGRCGDLLESADRAMDWCCGELSRHLRAGEMWQCSNFNLKDMMVLYAALEGRAEARRCHAWRDLLAGWEPEDVYHGHDNWWFYATAAEQLRIQHGLSDRSDWIDAILADQMDHWTDHGMYRDPGDPVTYDLTVRQCLAMMLDHGYTGRHVEWARETLRAGALTTLLTLSPAGVVAFGGRSAQYHLQEGMLAWVCEWQARQEARTGNARLAGALRRAALAGAEAVGRWLRREPYAVGKHLMASQHPFFGQDGFPEDQNAHSGYGLLAANLLAGAYHVADPSIEPGPMPADTGGYALHLPDAFWRVWATAGGYHIQIDTRGQPHYDATGLGRIHRRGAPIEAALNMSIAASPNYRLPMSAAPRRVAFGPGWPAGDGWRYLSELSRDDAYEVSVRAPREGEEVEVRVRYQGEIAAPRDVVRERYRLSSEGLRYEAQVPGAERVRLQIPAIETDGEATSRIELSDRALVVRYRGHTYTVRVAGAARALMEDRRAPNRNGVHRVAVFEVQGERVSAEAELVPA